MVLTLRCSIVRYLLLFSSCFRTAVSSFFVRRRNHPCCALLSIFRTLSFSKPRSDAALLNAAWISSSKRSFSEASSPSASS